MAPTAKLNPVIFQKKYEEAQSRPQGGGGGIATWKVKVAPLGKPSLRNVIRMLPPHENMLVEIEDPETHETISGHDVIIGTKLHFSLGPKNDTASPCLEPYGEECPACDFVSSLYTQARNEQDPERAQALKDRAYSSKASYRYFANIIDMAKPEAGVQTYAFDEKLEARIRACFKDDEGQHRDITDPMTGRDIIIEVGQKAGWKPGQALNDYTLIKAKDSASELFDHDLLDKVRDLTEEVYKPTLDQVKQAMLGKRVQRPTTALVTNNGSAALGTPPPRPVGSSSTAQAAVAKPPATPPPPAAKKPAAPPAPVAAARPARQPVGVAVDSDPLARAKAEITASGFSGFKVVTIEEIAGMSTPSCFSVDPDPSDPSCQSCSALLVCYSKKNGYIPV